MGTRARRRLVAALREDAQRKGRGCERPDCQRPGVPIDYAATAGHPLAFEVDEVVPRVMGGDPLDPRNVRPAHALCNRGAGSRLARRRVIRRKPLDADDW